MVGGVFVLNGIFREDLLIRGYWSRDLKEGRCGYLEMVFREEEW